MADAKKTERLKFLMVFIITLGFLGGLRHLFNFSLPAFGNEELEEDEEILAEASEPIEIQDSLDGNLAMEATIPTAAEDQVEKSFSEAPATEPDSATEEKDSLTLAIEDSLRRDSINRRNTALFRQSGKIWNYDDCLPDSQEQHISPAKKLGINPVSTREAVLHQARNHNLVCIAESPFFMVEKLDYSMPYLIPKARDLLTKISLNFLDSLQSKGYKPYLPIVTSALRTTDDVQKLTRRNRNATDNSCHCYGTTFDITYSRYIPLTGIPTPVDSAEWKRGEIKLVLAEVLYDLRNEGRCFVKHERKQPCFHITVR